MSSTINVDTVELVKKSKRMRQSLDSFNKQVNVLYNTILPEIIQNWKGKDNEAYVTKLATYTEELNALGESINMYINFLNQAAEKYEKTAQEAEQIAKAGR